MSIKLGITGGIGSGKSVVSRLLGMMGVPVYLSDTESKRLVAADPHIRRELTALLGEEVYRNGELNKPLLAGYLFGDPEHARKVNGIIHPRVKADFRQWVEEHKDAPLVALEAAILIEAGFAGDVDYIVMVYAPTDIRIERAMKRDASSREAIAGRIQHQMSDEEKKARAHYTILNDGTQAVIPQVEDLLNTFTY
ncbi:MAG: dephospho-CoA kinase [Mediterranea sp.]|jgi:dephospho-CoA kinase|nr:dephospho-CoA kinase [Mediterranea sp.]